MRLLLTSGGVTNPSIDDALVDLLGRPIAECTALCIPTASYPMTGGPAMAWRQIIGTASTPLVELGWKSLGVLELTALPTVKKELWVDAVRETDALLVGGGDPLYLSYWMRRSGLADLFPSLHETVYAGISAGSMVLGSDFGGETYGGVDPAIADEGGLGLVDIAMFPHVDHPELPDNSMAEAQKWAALRSAPTYAVDDQTAIRVQDGKLDVISEGHWELFSR